MEQNIEKIYRRSLKMNTDEKIRYLEDFILICEDFEEPFYRYIAQFDLIAEYKKTGQNYRAIQLYMDSIRIYLENTFDSKNVINEFPWMARHIESTSSVSVSVIRNFFDSMRIVFKRNGASLRSFYQEYFSYLIRVGEWEEGLSVYTKWVVETRDSFSQSIAKEEADRAIYYFLVGDYENAKYVFQTVEKGVQSPAGTKTYAYPRVVRFFLELREWEMTSYLIQRSFDFSKNKPETIEEIAEILKPLAILNTKIALKVWKQHRYYFAQTDNQRAKFSFGVAAYLITQNMDTTLAGTHTAPKLDKNIKQMYDIQKEMDERNGNNSYHQEIMYWLELKNRLN